MGLLSNRGCSGHVYGDEQIVEVGVKISHGGKYVPVYTVRQECQAEDCHEHKRDEKVIGFFENNITAYHKLEEKVGEME